MYTPEQFAEMAQKHSREIATLQESLKSAHHRLSENNKIAESVNALANSVTEMTAELRHLTKRMDTSIEKIEAGQKAQGVRIGEIEKAVLTITRNEKDIEGHEKRLDIIEKASAHKWDKLTWLILSGVAAAIVAYLMSQIL